MIREGGSVPEEWQEYVSGTDKERIKSESTGCSSRAGGEGRSLEDSRGRGRGDKEGRCEMRK